MYVFSILTLTFCFWLSCNIFSFFYLILILILDLEFYTILWYDWIRFILIIIGYLCRFGDRACGLMTIFGLILVTHFIRSTISHHRWFQSPSFCNLAERCSAMLMLVGVVGTHNFNDTGLLELCQIPILLRSILDIIFRCLINAFYIIFLLIFFQIFSPRR